MLEIIMELAGAAKVTAFFFLMLLLCTFDCDARGGTETAGGEAAALWGRVLRPICHVYRAKGFLTC